MATKFVTNTWLLAQLIHPVLFHFWTAVNGSDFGLDEHLQWALLVLIFTVLGFLLCLSLIGGVCKMQVRNRFQFLVWVFVTVMSVPVTIFLVAVLFGGLSFFLALFELLLPGCVAAVLSTVIRYRQFVKLQQLNYAR